MRSLGERGSWNEYAPEAGNDRQSWGKFFGRVFNGLRRSVAGGALDKEAGTKGPREQGSKGPKVRTLESCHGQPEGMSGIIHAKGCGDVDQAVISG